MRTSLWDESEQKRNVRVAARQPEWLLAADGHFLLGEKGRGVRMGRASEPCEASDAQG